MMFYDRLLVTAGAQPGHVTWKLLESDVVSVKGALAMELLMPKKIRSITLQ